MEAFKNTLDIIKYYHHVAYPSLIVVVIKSFQVWLLAHGSLPASHQFEGVGSGSGVRRGGTVSVVFLNDVIEHARWATVDVAALWRGAIPRAKRWHLEHTHDDDVCVDIR